MIATNLDIPVARIGQLTLQYCKVELPVQVLRSHAGFFIGTLSDSGPSRESVEYYRTEKAGNQALQEGTWTQRLEL